VLTFQTCGLHPPLASKIFQQFVTGITTLIRKKNKRNSEMLSEPVFYKHSEGNVSQHTNNKHYSNILILAKEIKHFGFKYSIYSTIVYSMVNHFLQMVLLV